MRAEKGGGREGQKGREGDWPEHVGMGRERTGVTNSPFIRGLYLGVGNQGRWQVDPWEEPSRIACKPTVVQAGCVLLSGLPKCRD